MGTDVYRTDTLPSHWTRKKWFVLSWNTNKYWKANSGQEKAQAVFSNRRGVQAPTTSKQRPASEEVSRLIAYCFYTCTTTTRALVATSREELIVVAYYQLLVDSITHDSLFLSFFMTKRFTLLVWSPLLLLQNKQQTNNNHLTNIIQTQLNNTNNNTKTHHGNATAQTTTTSTARCHAIIGSHDGGRLWICLC